MGRPRPAGKENCEVLLMDRPAGGRASGDRGFFEISGGASEPIEFAVKYHGDLAAIAERTGASAEDLGLGYAVLTLPRGGSARLYSDPQIEDVEPPKELYISDYRAQRAACVPEARELYGLTGAGTAVGIIDTGVDYAHPEFIGPDGRSRIAFMWDQQAGGPPPDGFSFGREYTAADFDRALVGGDPYAVIPRTDFVGHGTAVCGIAAGNTGVAPGAVILAVLIVGLTISRRKKVKKDHE